MSNILALKTDRKTDFNFFDFGRCNGGDMVQKNTVCPTYFMRGLAATAISELGGAAKCVGLVKSGSK